MTRIERSLATLAASGLLLGAELATAGAKIAIDDTRSLSIGAAVRAGYSSVEDAAPSGNDWSGDFNLDSARIYLSGQLHEYVKVEVNTECVFCGNSNLQDVVVLDAIAKFEFSPAFNIWAGRLLVPAERQELNGPYYSTTYEAYKTPFYGSDYSVNFGNGGAGVYARDHGVVIWGAGGAEGAFQYAFGLFNGLESSGGSGPNRDDTFLYATRLAWNLLSVEKNPGYYTSGTYYGTGGDIFTLGVAMQYQEDGAGSRANPGDFLGISFDALFEKVMADKGVFTFNAEYKTFDADFAAAAFGNGDCFCMFDGTSYSIAALYLFPQPAGAGRFQPYARYSDVDPEDSSERDEVEFGINYVIDGHNARVSLSYTSGDIATKGLNYAPNATGDDVSGIRLAFQVQL